MSKGIEETGEALAAATCHGHESPTAITRKASISVR